MINRWPKNLFFNCHQLLSIGIDYHRHRFPRFLLEVKREIFYRRNTVKWNYITITNLSGRTRPRNRVKHQTRSMLHFNVPVINFSYLPWHPAWQCEAIVILVVYSSKIYALIPLDYTMCWILLACRFSKVIPILMGTFIPLPGRHLAIASLTGLPVTVPPKWTNLLSSSEQQIARQLQQKKGTCDNP